MSWHYRIRRRTLSGGDTWFDIVEYYDNPTGWTADGMTPGSGTREGLLDELERMLSDAKKYDVVNEGET